MNKPNLKVGMPLYLILDLGPIQVKIEKITTSYVYVICEDGQKMSIRKEEAYNLFHKPTQDEIDSLYMWSTESDRPYLNVWF